MYKEMMDSIGMIQSIDPELGSAMNEERTVSARISS